jgi:hypothetical protein
MIGIKNSFDEFRTQRLEASVNYLYFSSFRLLAPCSQNFALYFKALGFNPRVQDAVDESDTQNVFVFQSTGLLKVISVRTSFLGLSIVHTHHHVWWLFYRFRPSLPSLIRGTHHLVWWLFCRFRPSLFKLNARYPPPRVVDAIGSMTLSPLSA